MRTDQLLQRVRPPGSARPLGSFSEQWAMRIKGIDLQEELLPNGNPRPANSPIHKGTEGNVQMELAQNTETGVYTALVGVIGRKRAVFESTDLEAALDGAFAAYADLVETRAGLPSITVGNKAEIAAIRARPTMGGG